MGPSRTVHRASVAALATMGAAALLAGASCGTMSPLPTPSAGAQPRFDVLVFTRTTGFRHDSIPAAVKAIRVLGDEHGFSVDHNGR